MYNAGNDIRDDEFRIVGKVYLGETPELAAKAAARDAARAARKRKLKRFPILPLILILGIGILVVLLWPKPKPEPVDAGVFEIIPETPAPAPVAGPFGHKTERTFTERIDTVINDVPLAIYIPHNATPELTVGVPDRKDESIIFAAQAADIRRDNRKILGAFVLKGTPLAWGLSKKGFCAIIDGVVTIGVSENSPLFEEATEKGGYFFRQYPLVDNGTLVENGPKNKAIRKALCTRAGQIFVVVSGTEESFHDFSQALVDLGVENAIYLVGSSTSFGWTVDADGNKTIFAADVHRRSYKNESYIIWR